MAISSSILLQQMDDYVLDGSKVWVTNGARAAFYVIHAPRPSEDNGTFLLSRLIPGLQLAAHPLQPPAAFVRPTE